MNDSVKGTITSAGTIDLGTVLTSTPSATDVTIGGFKLYTNAYNTVTPNAVTSTSSRTYAIQLNSSGQAVVNVPWTDTNTHLTSKNIIGASTTAKANAAASNGNVYLNHLEDSNIMSSHKIIGSGATAVTSDSNGNIIISSANTDT